MNPSSYQSFNQDQMYSDFQAYQFSPYMYQNLNPPPPKGPYPGTTYEEYGSFDITKQQYYQRFLRDMAIFYLKTLPKYQQEMEKFLKDNIGYQMTEDEHNLMDAYLRDKKEREEHEKLLQQIQTQTQEAEKESTLEQPEKLAQQAPVNKPAEKDPTENPQQAQQPTSTQPVKKKLKITAKKFEVPDPPKTPQFPKVPDFLDTKTFYDNYFKYINYYQPQSEEEFMKFPTPEKEKQKQQDEENKRRKKSDEIKRAIDKRNAAIEKKKNAPKTVVTQEKKVDLENLEVDLTQYVDPDESRQPVNLVFIGHVDAGKSTLCGRLLLDLGEVSEADVKKYEQEAVQNNRDSWWLAYVMDQNDEEKERGKTVECGKALFSTKNKRFILSDAPGHKNYVPNMIMGACQADIAGLILSAKQGEFESGFEKSGQTQEHAILARSLGVDQLILVITKMDTVDWNQERFTMISEALSKYCLEVCKFSKVHVIPIDALGGNNISKPLNPTLCPWYKGPHLIELLDQLQIPRRDENGPIRIPILDKFKDQGNVFVYGKLESGKIIEGLEVSIYPRKMPVQISSIYNYKEQRMKYAKAGENVKIKLKGIDDQDLKRGQVICNLEQTPCQVSTEFMAKIKLLDLPEQKKIVSEGFACVMHLHTAVEEVEISAVEACLEKDSGKLIKQNFLKSNTEGIVKISIKNPICVEKSDFLAPLARFALRDSGMSIAFGEVTKIKQWKPVA